MSEELQSSPTRANLPLQGVVIFVSQQLGTSRTALHQQCTTLGGKFVWVFDMPFTHYICQGKLSKRGKEYRKAEEYRATCVHPAWLRACHSFGQRLAEKLYATTYNPNRSLTFLSAADDEDGDEDEENHVPSLTTKKPAPSLKLVQKPRLIPTTNKRKTPHNVTPAPATPLPSPKVIPPSPKLSSQMSNEAETMLNDLQSSLAQFLHNNTSSNQTSLSRPTISDDEQNRKSLQIIRSISNVNNDNHSADIEPSMRVEWLDDAMRAERKKMIDEDEHGANSQQQSRGGELHIGQKRPLVDSNFDQSFNAKKCRI